MLSCLNPATAAMPDPEEFLRLAGRWGFKGADHGADFWAEWAHRRSLDYVREVCEDTGCVIAHGGLPVNFREDDDTFKADLKRLPRIAATMKGLDTTAMSTWIAPVTHDEPRLCYERHVRRLREVARVLDDAGLVLGLEFVGPKTSRREGTPFIFDMTGMLGLCADVHDRCGLLLDSYHWYTSHATVDDLLSLTANQVVHVHINDAYPEPIDTLLDMKRMLPGAGVIDLAGFLGALARIGYDGPVAVETFNDSLKAAGPEEAARLAGRAMARVMDGYV